MPVPKHAVFNHADDVSHTGLEPRTSRLRACVTTGDPHAAALQCIQAGLLLTRVSLALDP